MKNVNSHFIPTTVYNDKTIKEGNTATSYSLKISVEHLSYENVNDVLADIREVILQQLEDVLTPSTERKKKILTEN